MFERLQEQKKLEAFDSIFLRASAIARSESIDDIWLLLSFFLARFVKYSNIKADMALLMEYKVVRYKKLRFLLCQLFVYFQLIV